MAKSKFQKAEIRVVGMAALGGALEFYDFMIFVFLANVISPQYFPAEQHINSLLALFGAFTVGYLARPIGGMIFSHYGDRYGRKRTFYLSIILMAIPSFLIALLPTYEILGLAAPVFLILLRIIQGFAVGGEIPGAITFTFEHVAQNRRGRAVVLIFFALSLAILFGQGVVVLLHMFFSKSQFYNWAWRIAFLIGAGLGMVGGYLRKNLSETPEFKTINNNFEKIKLPFLYLLQNHSIELLQGLSILCLGAVSMFLLFVYMPVYIINFKSVFSIQASEVQTLNIISLSVFSIAMLFFGWISDYVSKKNLVALGSLFLAMFAYPLFNVILQNSVFAMLGAMIVLGVSFSMVAGCYGALLAELFPTKIRYTGVGLAYNIAFAAFGGTTPLIVTFLIKVTHNAITPAYYLMLFSVISLCGALTVYNKEKILSVFNIRAKFGK